jgi:hypothetical protein
VKKLSASQKFEEGLILFARYAFAPNYFRYCGPDKNKDIGEALKGNFDQRELRHVLNHFDAAVPYLNLIAKSNNIADPFDIRVVEAYWLGNDLLLQVPNQAVFEHLVLNVKKRAKSNWRYVESEIGFGVKPNHSFHVLDIYRIAGFTMDGTKGLPVVDLINNCRISWGVVKSKIGSEELSVKSQSIKVKNNKFVLEPEVKTVKNTGLDIKPGDLVSIHWGFICDKLIERQAKNLEFWTKYHLRITNRFI